MALGPLDPGAFAPLRQLRAADLERQLHIARRYSRPLSILLCEIDDLQSVSDPGISAKLFDHVGQKISQLKRGADLAGRWEKQEFLLILPETDLTAALSVAERLQLAVTGQAAPVPGYPVTLSAGVNQCNPEDEATDCLTAAFFWLYRAKAAGGNRYASCLDDSGFPYSIPL